MTLGLMCLSDAQSGDDDNEGEGEGEGEGDGDGGFAGQMQEC